MIRLQLETRSGVALGPDLLEQGLLRFELWEQDYIPDAFLAQ
jgi:hypothetical protein